MGLRWSFFFFTEMDTFHLPEMETFHYVGAFLFLFKLLWLHLNVFQNEARVIPLKKWQNKNVQLSNLSSDKMQTGLCIADRPPKTFARPKKCMSEPKMNSETEKKETMQGSAESDLLEVENNGNILGNWNSSHEIAHHLSSQNTLQSKKNSH